MVSCLGGGTACWESPPAHTCRPAPIPSLRLHISCYPGHASAPAVGGGVGSPPRSLLGSWQRYWNVFQRHMGGVKTWDSAWTEGLLIWDVRHGPDSTHAARGCSLQTSKQLASFVGGHRGTAAKLGARPGNGRQPGGAVKTCPQVCHLPGPAGLDYSHVVGLTVPTAAFFKGWDSQVHR